MFQPLELLRPLTDVVALVSWPFALIILALSIYGLAAELAWWRDVRRLGHSRRLPGVIDRSLLDRDLDKLERTAKQSRSLLSEYIQRWMYRLRKPAVGCDFDCEQEMRRLLPLIEASEKLRVLIAGNAVSLGMMFSVIGILRVFHIQANPTEMAGDPRQMILTMLSGGLGLALVTTVVGLTLAVVHLSVAHVMRVRTWRIAADLRTVQARMREVHTDLLVSDVREAA